MSLDIGEGLFEDIEKPPDLILPERWPVLLDVSCDKLAQAEFVVVSTFFIQSVGKQVPHLLLHTNDKKTFVIDKPVVKGVDPLVEVRELSGIGLKHAVFTQSTSTPSIFVLTDEGELRSAGDNSQGQLGRNGTTSQKTFGLVKGFPAKVRMVAAGEGHAMALTEDNEVYAWGENGRGQLGTDDVGVSSDTPKKVFPTEEYADEIAVHIGCGSNHSVLLTDSGKVLLCGELLYGEYCEGAQGTAGTFSLVSGLEEGKYKQVCCGVRHTVALRDDGVLFSWGGNRFGQLGLGKEAPKHMSTPSRVATWEEASDSEDEDQQRKSNKNQEHKEKVIDYIRCARVTCVAHAEDGSRLVWGRWKGEAHRTPRLYEESMHTVDGLATGSWGPESGGCVPLGEEVFGFWRLNWMGQIRLRYFMSLSRQPSDYNPWTNMLEKVATLVKEGGDGLASRDEDGATPLHLVARYKHHSGDPGNEEAEWKDKTVTATMQALVDAGAEVNTRDSLGCTPLYDAVARGNDVATKMLLTVPSVDIQSPDKKGRSPLHGAAKFGRLDLVPILIAAGADITASTKNGMRPIHQGVRKDNVPMVELLNKLASVAFPSMILRDKIKSGRTAVDLALYGESWNVLRWLLKNVTSAPMNTYNREGTTNGLHLSVAAGHEDIVEGLLRAHTDLLEMQDEKGRTALHIAAIDDQVHMAQMLLDRCVNTEARDKQRATPLQTCIHHGSIKVLRLLVENGANTDVLSKDNETVLHLAVKSGSLELLEVMYHYIWDQGMDDQMLLSTTKQTGDSPLHCAVYIARLDMIKFLLSKSAAISKKDKLRRNPMHIAASRGETEIVKEFLFAMKKRDIVDLVMRGDRDGRTPLHHAAHHNHWATAEAIVKTIERFKDKEDKQKWTALFYAAEHGHIETMEILLAAGADIKGKDTKQRTMLHVAASNGQSEAVSVLLKAGASAKAQNEHGQNVMDIAIAEKHEHVVTAIVDSDAWRDALDHQTNLNYGTGVLVTTPFRTLIRIMPEAAEKVMDRCITLREVPQEGEEGETGKKKKKKCNMMLEFDFKYIDNKIDSCHGHHGDKCEVKVPDSPANDSAALLEEQEMTELPGTPKTPCVKLRQPKKSITDASKPRVDKHVLEVMANSSKTVLKHPLVRALLRKKWKTTRYFVFSFLAFYTIFVIATSFYLMLSYPAHSINSTVLQEEDACEKATEEAISYGVNMWVVKPHSLQPVSFLIIVLAVIGIILEIGQMVLMRRGLLVYFRHITNFFDWFAYVSAICIALPVHPCHLRSDWQWQLGVLCILCVWTNFILFLRRLPAIGIYLLMILEMVRTLCMCLLGCLPIILTFVVAFVILHHNQAPFGNPIYSFFKIIVMMIGELDYGSQFHPDDDAEKPAMPVLAYLVYLCFLVVVTTVIMNLVTGIAVTAMEAIQDEAEEQKLILQVNLTLDVETALPMFLRRHFRWNDLHEERKIKDKHLKRMPLILRNKILYGGKDSTKSTCGHHSKAKRLDGEDILTISSVMFPGAHRGDSGDDSKDSQPSEDFGALEKDLSEMSQKLDRIEHEYGCMSSVELKLEQLERALSQLLDQQGKDGSKK